MLLTSRDPSRGARALTQVARAATGNRPETVDISNLTSVRRLQQRFGGVLMTASIY